MLDQRKSSRARRAAWAVVLFGAAVGCSNTPSSTTDAAVTTDTGIDAMDVADVPTGCTSNAACASSPGRPICNTATGQCVSCATMASACTAAQYCNTATGACEAGCATDEACAAQASDAGVADGGVSNARCDTITHACVQCVTNDHCPPGNLCRGSVCVRGCTSGSRCGTGEACCDGACVDTQSNVTACGACGTTCRTPNGRPACSMGACGVGTCTAPYENCDMNGANGCEVNLQTDPMNCGACGNVCPSGTSSMGVCVMGRCQVGCADGFADCDGNAANGCETDTRADNANCGLCGRTCALRNATSACATSACTIGMCNTGFGDCDGDVSTGCETSTQSNPLHCGRCGNVCNLTNVAVHGCTAGACSIVACSPGFADCDGNPANGCEVNTDTTNTNCGRCGNSCGAGTCTRGVCTATCAGGRGDCDGDATNACETDLNTSVLNCGACRNACVAGPQATARCTSGACSIVCSDRFLDCNRNAADGCEIDSRVSPTNCGACGTVCATGQTCNDGVCAAPCPGVQTRCAGTCVSIQTDNNNCGACGNRCPTGSTCTDGVCRCALGGSATGGVQCGSTCVDVLSSNTNCGTCGTACPTGSTCTRGVCRCTIGGVATGLLCGSTCVDPFADRNNCGACGRACASGQSCTAGICTCPSGTVCGGVCTDTAADRTNCGACGRTCATGETCLGGTCLNFGTGTFRVDSLTATACNSVEHASTTGDDRGGIAVSTTRAFYSGDSATGAFALDVSSQVSVGRLYDALVSEISTGTVYTLGTSATTPLPNGGGTVTHLIPIDGTTGALGSSAITLSRSFTLGSQSGFFAGSGRVGFHDGGSNRAWVVLLPAGTVLDLGAMPAIPHTTCESWAYWGTLEFFGGVHYFDVVTNSTTISRVTVPTGTSTSLATFTNLSDMCSFVVSRSTGRWYWHHEGGSQFRSGDESIGYCNATFSTP